MSILKSTLLFFLAITESAWAGGLGSPFSLDSAGVLPAGIRSVRLTTFTTELTQKFDSTGTPIGLANKFNRDVLWKDLINAQPTGFERDSLQGYVESEGIKMSEVAGRAFGEANVRITGTVPVMAYGFTERLTGALIIPVVYSSVSVATGWVASEQFQARVDQQVRTGKGPRLSQQQKKLNNVVAAKIDSLGYQPLQSENHSEIGDIVLGLKYQALKTDDLVLAFTPRIVLATGRVADPNKVIDVAPGDGQYDLGLGAVAEWSATANFTFYTGASYIAQLPAQKAKRIPQSREEALSADIDYNVREDLGDIFSASMGSKYKLASTWTLGAQVSFQYKQPDSYTGWTVAPERYSIMSDDTEASLQTLQLALTYSTIPLFREKRFPIPLEASLGHTWATSGKNANVGNVVAFELAAFF